MYDGMYGMVGMVGTNITMVVLVPYYGMAPPYHSGTIHR